MVIPGDNSQKRADSAADNGFCAYNIDFFAILYAFSGNKLELQRLLAGKRTAAHAGSRGVAG